MTIVKDTTVTVTDGNLRIHMGKGLTTLYVSDSMCERSLFVLKTAGEIDRLMEMLKAAKETLAVTQKTDNENNPIQV